MGHIFKRPFDKTSRKAANRNSSSTIRAKKAISKLEKKNGAKTNKNK